MLRKIGVRILTVVMVLLALYAVWNIIRVRGQLSQAEDYRRRLTGAIVVLTKENEELEQAIAQAEDAEVIAGLARKKLGLVMPGEVIFMEKEDSGKRKSGG